MVTNTLESIFTFVRFSFNNVAQCLLKCLIALKAVRASELICSLWEFGAFSFIFE